jgi:dipeptidyl-peptidase 4
VLPSNGLPYLRHRYIQTKIMMRSKLPVTAILLVLSFHLLAQKPLTNKDIWYSPIFSAKYVGGLASMNDGEHYTVLEAEGDEAVLRQYAYKTGTPVKTLFRASELVPPGADAPVDIAGYSFSGDERMLMIETASEPIYRHSYQAHHYVFNRSTRALLPLSDPQGPKQRLATFSPDGSHAAFVRDNDLYVVKLANMKETRITTDGEWNKVLNGATDWVYEEEFKLVQGYAWNSTGSRLLYLRSDESDVKEFDLTFYQGQLYPSEYRFKYPKAGETNSRVSLHVFDIPSGQTTSIPIGVAEEVYIPRLGWTADKDVLWFMRMNRLQNEKVICTVNLAQRSSDPIPTPVYQEVSKTYVEVTDDLHFLQNGTGFVLSSDKSGWNHIYHVPFGGQPKALTNGNWDVVEIKGIDERNKRVIFTASRTAPEHQEVWAVPLSGKAPVQLSPTGGFSDAEFSTGFRYFINTRSTRNTPPAITLHEGSGRQVKVLESNEKLAATLKEYGVVPREFFTFTTEGGVELRGWMMRPPGFKEGQRYPVLMTQYSGPNSNEVLDQFDGRTQIWHAMLAQKGYIVACVDGRGTGHRGTEFRHMTYGQLGRYETEDQIAAARWLAKQPYVDGDRIGIQGWSYGGYMSSLCITKGADVFKAAIAVAPVTNWRFYDSIYTERYMGLPQDNPDGYDDNSPINHVDKLRGNYLLIHGLADDNVHYQNAAEMVLALVKANKRFDQFMYPDKNHGIYGGTTRMHLFEMMTQWLERNL